ncbi:hypothetical protein [Lapillicoccus sp.]|uniref:hypothetical protein n=1 Tax=Lapillicoccus sp. TaxID=1909287 RepID=UPI003266DD99
MGGPRSGGLRIARAVCLASVVLGLAGTAHVVGGGVLPPAGVVAGLGALVGFAAVLLTGRRCGVPTLVTVMGVTQFALHAAFEACSVPAGGLTPLVDHHHMEGMVVAAPSASAAPMAMGPMPVWISVCHAVAALVCAVLLSYGERALCCLWSWFAPSLPQPEPRVLVYPSVDGMNGARMTVSRVWCPATPLRGPPEWVH